MTPIPSVRLLWAVGVVAVFAIAAGPLEELRPVLAVLILTLLIAALIDLAISMRGGNTVFVSAPPVVRFAKDREGVVDLTIRRAAGMVSQMRFALGLPPAFASAEQELMLVFAEDALLFRTEWKATPATRGRFTEVLACMEWPSRLGLWELCTRQPVQTELRVYPNLFSERKQLAALFLARGQLGAKLQRTVGRGREFEKLRDYQPGDGFDEIHWKATAKRNRPITKVFQAERTQEIHVAIDVSRLSARRVVHEGREQTALERYLTAALILLLAAEQNGDRFGLLVYDDRVRVYLPARYGHRHYTACREAMHSLEPGAATPDMAEIVRYIRTSIRQRALLFFLTDLSDPVLADDFLKQAPLLARQHLVMVNQLRAPDVAPLFAGGEVRSEKEIYAKLAGHTRWVDAQNLIKRLKPHGVTATLMEDETLAAQLVTQYLTVKQKQTL